MLRLIGTLSCIWLVMAISSVAEPVLDTTGQALQSGVEYYILPNSNQSTGSDSGGGLTLVDRNGSYPLYVGQEDLAGSNGLPVIFTPFFDGETVIQENRDFRVAFSGATTCVQSTSWEIAESDAETDVCPTCRFINCGPAGILIENRKKLLALDSPAAALPVVFKRA